MLQAITTRHNLVLGRLSAALPVRARGSLSLGREMRSVTGQALKPDLVINNGTDAVIVDVTCPFDGGPDALEMAAQGKVEKYTGVARALLAAGHRSAVVRPFVIGALGSWWPGNEACLADLGIPRSERVLLCRL